MRNVIKRPGWIYSRIIGERRFGIDRRKMDYDWHVPERRAIGDRRQATRCIEDSHAARRMGQYV